ncbi:DMT family transporter [Algirhabdus cladophorae]|uniref:DMT family transporter n=1 Tax=Algirhabdus cladophorae TaxID=3377108 RepID=UPI003B84AEDB
MSHTVLACLWMTGAIVSFSSMAVGGRAISAGLDTFEIMMYRSFIGIAIVVSLAKWSGTLGQINRAQIGLHVVRNICHFTGQNLWFAALPMIPLAQLFALEFTSPLWILLLAPIFLGERLTANRIAAAIAGFIGILVVVRPGVDTVNIGVVMAALAAIGFAGSIVFTRMLTRTDSITSILFFLTVLQALFGVVCAGFDGDIALPDRQSVPWLILVGCAGLLAHYCLTKAVTFAPVTVIIPVDFLRLPLIAVIGMVFYDEGVDPWVIVGAAIIFIANYANILIETRKAKI